MSIWTGLKHMRMVVVNALRQENSDNLTTTSYFNSLPIQAVTFVNSEGEPINFGGNNVEIDPVITSTEYDVVLVVGQSNSTPSGGTKNTLLDIDDARMLQYPNGGIYNDKLVLAREPIFQGTGVIEAGNENNISFPTHFCKQYLRSYPNKKVVIIPMGIGNTGFGNNRWNPGDDLYNNAVNQTNQFLTNYPGSKLVVILFHMGERDKDDGVPVNTQRTRLLAFIDGLRADITDADNVPFIAGGHSPDWVPSDLLKALYNDMYLKLNRYRNYVGYASPTGLSGGGVGNEIHFNAESMRTLGDRYFSAWLIAREYILSLPPIAFNIVPTIISGNALKLAWQIPNGVWESFRIQYRIVGTEDWLESPDLISTTNLLTDLTPSTTYQIRIRSINALGSTYSDTVITTTSTTTTNYVAPKVWLKFETNNINQNDNEYGWLSATNLDASDRYVDSVRGNVCRFPSDGFLVLYRNITTNYTRCAWMKLESYRSFAAIFGAENGDNAGKNDLLVNGVSGLQVWNNYNFIGTTPDNLPLDTWVHVAVTYSSVGSTHSLYINGLKSVQFTGNSHTPNGTNNTLFIGAITFGNGFWNNPLDDVMVFDYAMNEAELAKVYQDTQI